MGFNEWLVENGYASSVDNIEYDLSADEVYVLYQEWENEEKTIHQGNMFNNPKIFDVIFDVIFKEKIR